MTHPDPATLDDFIARLEAATGEDRILNREIACGLGGWHRVTHSQHGLASKKARFISPEEWIGRDGDGKPICDSLHGTTMHVDVPALTTSIDAALALVERGGGSAIDILAEAVDDLTRAGFRRDEPIAPQIARAVLVVWLRALRQDAADAK